MVRSKAKDLRGSDLPACGRISFMRKNFRVVSWMLLVVGFFSLSFREVRAVENLPNNLFGIHLAVPHEEDLADAAALVNSNGGDWGYVTLVIQENDRDTGKWQGVFDRLRELHLVPIVRLATQMEGSAWRCPAESDAAAWADFLDSLNWVVKERYVVLFNEPNHAAEWGGKVNPGEYGRVALSFARALEAKDSDFVPMLAGFDAAAPHNPPGFEDEAVFLRQMKADLGDQAGELWAAVEAWASHSYPNHGFVGQPDSSGKYSVRGYQWELAELEKLGVGKTLPVFITETGWPHREGVKTEPGYYQAEVVADYLEEYLAALKLDPRVRAVTPFVLNYQDEPFDHFSWRKLGSGKEYYPQHGAVLGMSKIKGEPEQKQVLEVTGRLPGKLVAGSVYALPVKVRNAGQAIWDSGAGDELKLAGKGLPFEYFFTYLGKLAPFEEETVWLYLKTTEPVEAAKVKVVLRRGDKTLTEGPDWELAVVPQIRLVFGVDTWTGLAGIWPQMKRNAQDITVRVLTPEGEPVFRKTGLVLVEGEGEIDQLQNVVLGDEYRLELSKDNFLPQEVRLIFEEGDNRVSFKPLLQLDFNGDGRLTWRDVIFF